MARDPDGWSAEKWRHADWTATAPLVLVATWALVVGATFWLAARTSPYLPKFDDWPAIVPALTGHQAVTAEWLWHPHVSHRIVLPRLIYLAAFHVAGGDFRAGQFSSVCLLGLTALLGMGLARRWRGSNILADAFFPLMLLHWGQSQLFLLGTILNFTLAVALNYCALFVLLRAGSQLGWKSVTLLFACVTGLALTGTVGLLMAMPYLVWLGGVGCLQVRESQRAGWRYLGLAALLALIVTFPLIGLPLEPQPLHGASADAPFFVRLDNVAVIAAMSLGWLGRSCFVPSLGIVIGLSLATAGGLAYLLRRRPEERYRVSALLLFMFGSVVFLASLGYGRAGIAGEPLWATTRYAAIPVALLVTAFLSSFYLGRFGAVIQSMLCVLAGIVFLGSALGAGDYPYGLQPFLQVRAHEDALIRGVLSGKTLEQVATDFFVHENGYSPRDGAAWLAMLREKQLGPFGMSERQQTQILSWWEPNARHPCSSGAPAQAAFLATAGAPWAIRPGAGRMPTERVSGFGATPPGLVAFPSACSHSWSREHSTASGCPLALNGHVLTTLELDRWDWQDHVVSLPAAWLRADNTLELLLPDAVSPRAIGYNNDPEPHGVLVQSIDVTCVGAM